MDYKIGCPGGNPHGEVLMRFFEVMSGIKYVIVDKALHGLN